MLLRQLRGPFQLAIGVLLMAGCSQADDTDRPATLQALENQGLTVIQEFKAGDGLRAFAGVAGDQPIAVYLLPDGNAIVGTRVNVSGESIDMTTLQELVAKPMGDQAWEQLASAAWVLDGQADAPRVIYTFSDANCPYCNRFWNAARPWVEAGKVQLRHLMVGIIREDSPAKAAAILTADDPSAALRENESRFDRGGIAPAKKIPAEVREVLDTHQTLMLSQGFRGTPGIVVRDEDGLLQKYHGMPQPGALSEVLGPP